MEEQELRGVCRSESDMPASATAFYPTVRRERITKLFFNEFL